MAVRNHNWYNLRGTQNYPLADVATTTDDAGRRFPADILVDCHLRWPRPLGSYAFVSGVTVTATLVTVVVSAATSPTAADDFVPLAALTLLQPVDSYRPYSLTPLAGGVGGFLVFEDVREPGSYRFSTPCQSLLMDRCARPYTPLPISAMRKWGLAAGLTGLVRLAAGSDLTVSYESLEIAGYRDPQPAVVLRLNQAIANRNVLQAYLGPCDRRPESGTCDRNGIADVNGVAPDAAGNLNIYFVGVAAVPFTECGSLGGGTAVATDINLPELCIAANPQRFIGQDYCAPSSDSSMSSSSESESPPPVPSSSSSAGPLPSESSETIEWPVDIDFGTGTAPDFRVITGDFVFEDAGGDCYTARDGSRRNLAVWDPGDGFTRSTLNCYCATAAQLTRDTVQRNASLVVNYRTEHPLTNPHPAYLLVELDPTANAVNLKRFTGQGTMLEHAATCPKVLRLGDWYCILVTTQPGSRSGQVVLTVNVSGVTDPTWTPVTFALTTSRFGDPTGRFGLSTDRAHARFAYFQLGDRV